MYTIKTLFVVFLIHNTLGDGNDPPFKACLADDVPCLNKAFHKFNGMVAGGIPGTNYTKIDPFSLPDLDVLLDDGVTNVQLTHVNIFGLKSISIKGLKLNSKSKWAELTLGGELKFEGQIIVKRPGEESSAGGVTGVANVKEVAKYSYELYEGENGKEHFSVGPAELDCDLEDVTISADKNLVTVLPDPDKAEKNKKELLCRVFDVAIQAVIHNLRESAKDFPAEAFIIKHY